MLPGVKLRSRRCIPEKNGGKTCSQLLAEESKLADAKPCAGEEETPLMCPQAMFW
jgi:hypothetical protein